MTTYFISVMIVLVFLIVWRRLHQNRAQLAYKYKLYELRDALRELAYHGKVDSNSFIFDYFDNSLSKAIAESYYITIFHMVFLAILHEDDETLNQFVKKVEGELENHPELLELRKKYSQATKEYLVAQHFVSGNVFIIPLIKFIVGTKWAAKRVNRWSKNVFIFPETSASEEYSVSM